MTEAQDYMRQITIKPEEVWDAEMRMFMAGEQKAKHTLCRAKLARAFWECRRLRRVVAVLIRDRVMKQSDGGSSIGIPPISL